MITTLAIAAALSFGAAWLARRYDRWRRIRAQRSLAALEAFNEHADQALALVDPSRRAEATRTVEARWMEDAYAAPPARVPAIRHRKRAWQ